LDRLPGGDQDGAAISMLSSVNASAFFVAMSKR